MANTDGPNYEDIDIDVESLRQRYEEERAKRLRSEGVAQFQALEGKFADFGADLHADPNFTRDAIDDETDVLIVGGGFAGLLAGANLKKQGVQKVRIVEKGSDFGGTWYWNRYPGAACDVEAYIYMPMLEELGYIPSEKYAKAPEIYAHCQKLAEEFNLYTGALFHTAVETLRWNGDTGRWAVTTNRGDKVSARFVISCTGLLSKPKLPGIPGIESFEGHSFHTSRWDYDYTGGHGRGELTGLADKNVGIIGTGSTAIQVIPYLGECSKHLYVFQRTPSAVYVRNNQLTDSEWAKSLSPGWQYERTENFTKVIAGIYQSEDLIDDGWTDVMKTVVSATKTGEEPTIDFEALQIAEMKKMEGARRRIDAIVKDKATADALKPYYDYNCKRPCFHDEYLQTFNRPNVTLVDTKGKGVERITPAGVVVDGKEYPIDCLIYATGFDFMTEFTKESGLEIHGRNGQSLNEHWKKGARTLYGMQTVGFPNFFLMSLVQSGVSVNYVHIAEEQVKHISHIIATCLDQEITAVEPTEEAEAAWVETIVSLAGPRRAFLNACTPGYYNYEGKQDDSVLLNELYAGGPINYIRILEAWRKEGSMKGLKLWRSWSKKKAG